MYTFGSKGVSGFPLRSPVVLDLSLLCALTVRFTVESFKTLFVAFFCFQ